MSMRITAAFPDGGAIPSIHTCEGRDVSPALHFQDPPPKTHSLVLIVDDPDAPDPRAPKMTWVHWVLWDLPPGCDRLVEGIGTLDLPPGTHEGLNDWHRKGWGGPCPPIGRHRYFFKLYALDTMLGDLRPPNKASLEQAMNGHILAEAQLVGTYQKHRR